MAEQSKKQPKKANKKPAKAKLTTDQMAFLTNFNISADDFHQTGLDWKTLVEIREHHNSALASLQPTASATLDLLRTVEQVHSLKMRLKEPDHLVAKIIRKKLQDPEVELSKETYTDHITDLIGIRALHLFKQDWRPIHDFVMSTWKLLKDPIAYHRKGDPDTLLKDFKDCGFTVTEHEAGYRSIHYLLKSALTKFTHVVELQVRTIFEEGWSEIDHRIRYPYGADQVVSEFLNIFNRLSGSADEMGSFIDYLQRVIGDYKFGAQERDNKIASLQEEIDILGSKYELTEQEIDTLKNQVAELSRAAPTVPFTGITSGVTLVNALEPLLPVTDVLQVRDLVSSETCPKCGHQYSPFLVPGGKCPKCHPNRYSFLLDPSE